MEFGLEKCAKITFKRGKLTHLQNLAIDTNRAIQEPEQGKTYKYLGTEESEGLQHQQMKIETGIQQEIKNDTEI